MLGSGCHVLILLVDMLSDHVAAVSIFGE